MKTTAFCTFCTFSEDTRAGMLHLQGTNTEEVNFSSSTVNIPLKESINTEAGVYFSIFLEYNGLRHRISFLLLTPARPHSYYSTWKSTSLYNLTFK